MSTVAIVDGEETQMASHSPFIFTAIRLTPVANNPSLYQHHNVTFYTHDLNAINADHAMCKSTPRIITTNALPSPYNIDRNNPYAELYSPSIVSPSPRNSPFYSHNTSEDTFESENLATNKQKCSLEEQSETDKFRIKYSFLPRNSSTSSSPCYTPFGDSKLPQFNPPRFSRRLRKIIERRQRPLYLTLPVQNYTKLQACPIAPPQSALETPKSRLHDLFQAWCDRLDPRLLLLLSVTCVMGIIMLVAWMLTATWGY
ncbi:hypothetical protein RUND412_001591 [Rhizina undulata]